jgi:predicted TPR repeat methyltransferase
MNRAERRRLEKLGRKAPPETLLEQAARHHRAGRLAEAEAGYRAFLDRAPGHVQATHLLGLVCHQAGRNREAAALIAAAEVRSPTDPEIPYNLGNCLMLDGRPAEAVDAFRRALALRPGRADALNNLGTALQRLDRLDDAIAAYQGAIDAEPGRIDALSNLAHALQALGRREEALFTYRQVLARHPDHPTARHMVAAMAGETPTSAPDDFVRGLFDGYAERFDSHLTATLGYDPGRYVAVLRRAAGERTRFAGALDLGCGTGLIGTLLRPSVDRLAGVDLSPAMVAQAEAKAVYDTLSVAAIEPFLEATPDRFDLIFAADVFVYVGALDGVFAKAAARARPKAWFVFSVESADGDGFVLRPTGRYAHSLVYLARTMGEAGWEIREQEALAVRTEKGQPIAGYAVAAQLR